MISSQSPGGQSPLRSVNTLGVKANAPSQPMDGNSIRRHLRAQTVGPKLRSPGIAASGIPFHRPPFPVRPPSMTQARADRTGPFSAAAIAAVNRASGSSDAVGRSLGSRRGSSSSRRGQSQSSSSPAETQGPRSRRLARQDHLQLAGQFPPGCRAAQRVRRGDVIVWARTSVGVVEAESVAHEKPRNQARRPGQ